MAVEYLGAPQYDNEIKKYVGPRDGYGVIPRDILYKYNAYDVACTWDLYEWFEDRFTRHPDLKKVHDFLVATSNELMYVELNGITIDKEYLDILTEKYLKSLEEIEAELDQVMSEPKNY